MSDRNGPKPVTAAAMQRIASSRASPQYEPYRKNTATAAEQKTIQGIVLTVILPMYPIHWPTWVSRMNTTVLMEAFGTELTRVLLQEAINPEQLNYAIRSAPGRKFYPFPAPPDWLAMAKELIDARLPTVDAVMEEFDRYSARRGYFDSPEAFRWKAPILYWIVTDMRKAMQQYNHGVAELRKVAERLLRQWEKKLQDGEQIPEPAIRLGYTETPIGVGKERGLTTPETEKKGAALLQSIRLKVALAKTSKD